MSARTECSDSEDLSLSSLVTTKLGSGSYSCGFTSIENVVDHGAMATMRSQGVQEPLINTNVINSNVRYDRQGMFVDGVKNVDSDCSSESEEYSTDDFTPNHSPCKEYNVKT